MASSDKLVDELSRSRGYSSEDDQHVRFGKQVKGERAIRIRMSSPSYIKDAQSKAPQAIFKVTSFAKGASVRRVMEYITRTDRNEIGIPAENEDGSQLHGKDDVQAVYEEWSTDFERKKPGRKNEPRHATHIVLSAKTDNSDKSVRQVHAAASEFLRKEFGDQGFQYVFVVHKDTENPHVHVVIKNKNVVLNKKLRIGKAELFELRQEFAISLQEQGLEAVSTLRRDRPEIIEAVAKKMDTIKNRSIEFEKRLQVSSSSDKSLDPNSTNSFNLSDSIKERKQMVLALQSVKNEIAKQTQTQTKAMQNYQMAYFDTIEMRAVFAQKQGYIRRTTDELNAYRAVRKDFGEFRPDDKDGMKNNTNGGKGALVMFADGREPVRIENQLQLFETIAKLNKERGTFYDEKHIASVSPNDAARLKRVNANLSKARSAYAAAFPELKKTQQSTELKKLEDRTIEVRKKGIAKVTNQERKKAKEIGALPAGNKPLYGDVLAHHRQQLKAIDYVKKEIIKNTTFSSDERLSLIKEINKQQKLVINNQKLNLPKQIEATLKTFANDGNNIAKQLDTILENKPKTKESRLERKQREKVFSSYSEKYVKGITAAIKDVRANKDISNELRKDTLKRLSAQKRSVEKLRIKAFTLGI